VVVGSGAVVAIPNACLASGVLPETGAGDREVVLLAAGAAAVVAGTGLRRFRRRPTAG